MPIAETETRYLPLHVVAWVVRILGYAGLVGAVGIALETMDIGAKTYSFMDAAALAAVALFMLLCAECAFVLLGIEGNTRK